MGFVIGLTVPCRSVRGSSPTPSMLGRRRRVGICGGRCCEAGGAPGVKAAGSCR